MLRILQCNKYFATNCLILHPVGHPNKGPLIEQYLAEEAIGLAKSIGWKIVKGPFWNKPETKQTIRPNYVGTRKTIDRDSIYVEKVGTGELRDGDYIRTSVGNGFIEGDGMHMDFDQSESDGNLYRQWRSKLLRESLANSSLIKTKKITKKFYFTKGKLDVIARFIASTHTDCLFINAELLPGQVKNIRKMIEAKVNNLSSLARYESKEFDSETELETEYNTQISIKRNSPDYRHVRIFDRFSIILQIFAQRTTTKLSKLQIELSYLTYLKTRLVRDGSTYSTNLNFFTGDLMKTQQTMMEIISAKQRRVSHTLGGEGQSQLEIQRRNLRDKQAKIRREIEEETRLRQITIEKSRRRNTSVPVVALVGYTNVGKSAFMNALMKKNEVESKDILFQTLNTISRHIIMPSGTRIMLLDTIGFITNLPVEMVESFKSTLEEIAHADLVLHLRDISHPQNQLQKQSVIKILKELSFQTEFYNQKMLQVWNKTDLVKEQYLNEDGIHRISCETGEGIKELLNKIDQKLRILTDQKIYEIRYKIEAHSAVVQYLKEATNASYFLETEFDYVPTEQFPSGSVLLKVQLDEANYFRLMKQLYPETKRDRSRKGMPPKQGW